MITVKENKLPKSTLELEVTIPWSEIKDTYQKLFDEAQKTLEVPGFRKGKAPKKMAEEKIDKTKVYEEVIKQVIPKSYEEAIKKNGVRPISSPKVQVTAAKEGADWSFKALVALAPLIKLNDYKEKIKALKKEKASKIWVPGQEKTQKEEEKKPSLDELMDCLATSVEVEMSDFLVEEEANKLLSNLIDQTQKLGMTVEQYVQAKGTTSEKIRQEYAVAARKNLVIEFALGEIADKENISVTKEDIDALIAKVENPQEKQKLIAQTYYLAHLIRQQKTIDYLNNL